jgi:hypothetical protein
MDNGEGGWFEVRFHKRYMSSQHFYTHVALRSFFEQERISGISQNGLEGGSNYLQIEPATTSAMLQP